MTRGPYDLDAEEFELAKQEAAEFLLTIDFSKIRTKDMGNYYQKRPGLGITINGWTVDCSKEPHVWKSSNIVHAWRTVGEKRFGDSLKENK